MDRWIKPNPDDNDEMGSMFLRANADGAYANLPSAAASVTYAACCSQYCSPMVAVVV